MCSAFWAKMKMEGIESHLQVNKTYFGGNDIHKYCRATKGQGQGKGELEHDRFGLDKER